jgi:hypothetical protein
MHGRLLDATASDVWTQSHPEPGAPCPPPGELSPFVFLLAANILLLILGCVLEGTTILLTFVPVLLPTAQALGIDPVHFGVIVVVNIMIGLCSPPYGLLLLMMAKITGVPLHREGNHAVPRLHGHHARADNLRAVAHAGSSRLMGYKG